MRLSAVVMLIAGSIASVLGATAHGSEKARPSILPAQPSASALARYDVNRDGTLDVAERAAMRQDILRRVQPLRDATLRQYDWNKNGRLDDDERLAHARDVQARHEQVEKWALQTYDANRNGVLDPEEQQTRKGAREEWLRQMQSRILVTFDANQNGTLDPEERAVIRQKNDAARQAALDLYDTNRDGRVDDAERSIALGGDAARGNRTQARAGKAGTPQTGKEGADAAAQTAAGATGSPTLTNLRVSPRGGSYSQGAEIAFSLGQAGRVTVRIHDAAGRLVRTLVSGEELQGGAQVLRWDGADGNGHKVANGLYVVTVEAFGNKAARKVPFIR